MNAIGAPAGYVYVSEDVLAFEISGTVCPADTAMRMQMDEGLYPDSPADLNRNLKVLAGDVDDQTPRWRPFYEVFRFAWDQDYLDAYNDRREARGEQPISMYEFLGG